MSDLFDAHCAWLKAGGSAARTVEARRHWLSYADRQLDGGLVDADQAQLTAWFNAQPWSLATLAKAHYHLRAFFDWGIDPRNALDPAEPIFDDHPMTSMRTPKVRRGEPRPITDGELAIILTEAREPFLTASVLAVGAGLRAGEAAHVRREHVEEEQVWVKDGKGGKSAYAPALSEVWEHVKDFPRGVIIEHVGGRADWNWLSTRAAQHFRTLGLAGVSLHRLRHKYAELLRRAGCDVAVISKALRHEHLSSTEIYFRASEAECRLAVKALRLQVPVSA